MPIELQPSVHSAQHGLHGKSSALQHSGPGQLVYLHCLDAQFLVWIENNLPNSANRFGPFDCLFLVVEQKLSRKGSHELRSDGIALNSLVKELASCSTSVE